MITVIGELFLVALELYVACRFFSSFWNRRAISKWRQSGICLAFLILSFVLPHLSLPPPIKRLPPVVFIIAAFFLITFLFDANWKLRICYTTWLYAMCAICELASGMLLTLFLNSSVHGIHKDGSAYFYGILIAKLLLLFLVLVTNCICTRKIGKITGRISWHFLSIFVLTFSTLISVFVIAVLSYSISDQLMEMVIFITSILLTAVNIIAVFGFTNLFTIQEKKRRMELSANILQMQLEHQEIDAVKQKEEARRRHDFKNRLIAIAGLLKEENCQGAREEIEKLTGEFAQMEKTTGESCLDAVLANKSAIMKRRGITFLTDIRLPDKCGLNMVDFGTVLANALDNAIEGCGRMKADEERRITLSVFQHQEYFCLKVINTISGEDAARTDFSTSKLQPKQHGFGIENMRYICMQYDGSFQVGRQEREFQLKAMFKNVLL